MSEKYAFGPFQMDAEERQLLRRGEPLSLPPKAFQLLLLLVRNSGHVVEKHDALSEIWPDTFVEEASFSRVVSILRKLLGAQENGEPYIETVSKFGYRFVPNVRRLASEQTEGHSLAVLPLKVIGRSGGDDLLGCGIADTLITRLSNLPEIIVRPTSAVFPFGGVEQNPVAAGRARARSGVRPRRPRAARRRAAPDHRAVHSRQRWANAEQGLR